MFQSQSRLYNGGDYIVYMPKDEEHPYYRSDDWSYGSIVYWGELYENVPLLYDLSIDEALEQSELFILSDLSALIPSWLSPIKAA